jgi:hypothetical protein
VEQQGKHTARYDVARMPTDYSQELAALKNALEAARAYL